MLSTRRYIFNTLTVVSLLLLATVGLWVGSWHQVPQIGYEDSQYRMYGFWSKKGTLHFGCVDWYEGSRVFFIPWEPNSEHWKWSSQEDYPQSRIDRKSDWALLGFGYVWGARPRPHSHYLIRIPHWFLTLIFAVLPAVWLIKWNKRRKLGPNACPGCGYDLTGNETGVCPECGDSTMPA